MRDSCYTRHEFQVRMLNMAFNKIKNLNPDYSLRLFSKYLKVSHATLSLILNNKRKISKAVAFTIVDKLELDVSQKEIFLADYEEVFVNEVEISGKYNSIDHVKFTVMSEWQHFAILSLLETEDFRQDYKWIAERLNISVTLAKSSFMRLINIGLLQKKSGRWVQVGGPIRFKNTTSTVATKKFQEQMLKKSMESLKGDSFDIRDHSVMVFAMDPQQIAYAASRIRQFRYDLSQELESFGSTNEVYALSVQIFPMSKVKLQSKLKKESA